MISRYSAHSIISMLNNKIRLKTAQRPRTTQQHGSEGVQLEPGWAISTRGHIGGSKTDIGLNFRAERPSPPKGSGASLYIPSLFNPATFGFFGHPLSPIVKMGYIFIS